MAKEKSEVTGNLLPFDELNKAVIGYTLNLIDEANKVNASEKHKITAEITKLYAVINRVPVVDGLQAQV